MPAPTPSRRWPSKRRGVEPPPAEHPSPKQPKPILLWRQARFDRQRGACAPTTPASRPAARHAEGGGGAGSAQRRIAGPRAAAHEAAATAQGRQTGGQAKVQSRPLQGSAEAAVPRRRPDRSGKPHGEGGRPIAAKRGRSRNPEQGGKPAFQPKPREERPFQVDPLSPFAKLAALRDQLQEVGDGGGPPAHRQMAVLCARGEVAFAGSQARARAASASIATRRRRPPIRSSRATC